MNETLCLEEHPILHVMCLKREGHDGKHWFTARWDQGATKESILAEVLAGVKAEEAAEASDC